MANRLDLQTMLEEILGSRNVYFQPPQSIKMKYPAIRYALDSIENDFANDSVYMQAKSYAITVIDSDPDSAIVDKLSRLPGIRFNRTYQSDNLNHSVFTLYY